MVKSINDKYLSEGKRVLLPNLIPSDEASISILNDRAKKLSAHKVEDASKDEGGISYVRFVLGNNELYGIPYETMLGVKQIDHVTPIPLSPPFVVGVCYWHGKIISVIDLAKYFGLIAERSDEDNRFVTAISFEKYIIGLSFNHVIGVDTFYPDKLDRGIATNKKIEKNYIQGIHQGKTAILDIKNVLTDIVAQLTNGKGEQDEK